MTSPTVDFLFTCVGKNEDEVLSLVEKGNLFGRVLVGNQGRKENTFERLSTKNADVLLYNDTDYGVSKNRNRLLKRSEADYIVFLDDDARIIEGAQKTLTRIMQENAGLDCIRFNVKSGNAKRPIAFINKAGFVSFKRLTSVGVHGCFFSRKVLVEENLLFAEDMGPGTQYNHGEDTLFLRDFYRKKKKVYQSRELVFEIAQQESSWAGENRDIPKELISQGFLYHRLFGSLAYPLSLLFLLRKRRLFPAEISMSERKALIRQGIKEAKNT